MRCAQAIAASWRSTSSTYSFMASSLDLPVHAGGNKKNGVRHGGSKKTPRDVRMTNSSSGIKQPRVAHPNYGAKNKQKYYCLMIVIQNSKLCRNVRDNRQVSWRAVPVADMMIQNTFYDRICYSSQFFVFSTPCNV